MNLNRFVKYLAQTAAGKGLQTATALC